MNEILDQLRSTLESGLSGRGVTTFFKGVVRAPKKSTLPIIAVRPNSTSQAHSGTVRDRAEYNIAIDLYVNVLNYVDPTNGQGNQLDTLDALVDIMEERESDGDAKTNTVLGVINANLTIGNRVLYTDNVQIDYSDYYNPARHPVAVITATFTAYDRPNRT